MVVGMDKGPSGNKLGHNSEINNDALAMIYVYSWLNMPRH